MTDPLQPGPLKTLPGEGGTQVPFYVIPFDKNGVCTGPRTLDDLVEKARDASDIFVFSHGWNNDWRIATNKYDAFIRRYVAMRQAQWSSPNREYRPILVGVFWPSAVLVQPDEQAPDIAAEGDDVDLSGAPLDEIAALAEGLAPEQAQRFYELAQQETLDPAQAQELAQILAPVLTGSDDELDPDAPSPTPEDLLEVWRQIPAEPAAAAGTAAGGFIGDDAQTAPTTAGLLDRLKPRDIVRSTTVLLMKDRAGRVGGRGVGPMLRRLVGASDSSRVHLVGHSYGAKVVLSALSYGDPPARPVESVLLLQPATSALCFAVDVDGKGRPGGYRPALTRSRQAIMTTFSSHDVPLTKLFQWAARRPSDLGEAVIAGGPPSKYAALGGFGPQGAPGDVVVVPAKAAPDRYAVAPGGKRLIAIDADDVIGGHSDVTNPATSWALLCQVMG